MRSKRDLQVVSTVDLMCADDKLDLMRKAVMESSGQYELPESCDESSHVQ